MFIYLYKKYIFLRAAANKRRQALRRGTLDRLPPITTYGVGLSIIQYASNQSIVLQMMNRLTKKQINRQISSMNQQG